MSTAVSPSCDGSALTIDASVREALAFCVVCPGRRNDFEPFWTGLKRCRGCGHCVADVGTQDVTLHELYGDRYFSGEEYADYLAERSALEWQFRRRLKLLQQFQPDGDLIEIGCAYGFFLGLARQHYQVRGYDIAPTPVEFARTQLGVDARCEEFISAAVPAASADVVVTWDTVEHLARPDLMLQQAARVLRPGGTLCVTTGDISSALARFQKARWRLIHPPTHLHYFSRATMIRLLDRLGLQTVRVQYDEIRRSLRQIAFGLFAMGRPHPSWIYSLVARSPLADLCFSLNTYDIMLVVARKPRASNRSSDSGRTRMT